LGHVDGGTCSLREVGNAAEVIPVAVRDQDRRATRSGARELEPELGCFAAWVDDHCLRGVTRGANDVAVRADRAELVAVDHDVGARAHGWLSLTSRSRLLGSPRRGGAARTGFGVRV